MELELFRVKVFWPAQSYLYDERMSHSEVLDTALRSAHRARSKRGAAWHIGNLQTVDEHGVYFRIGRDSRARMAVRRPDTGDFEDEELARAPYTHALLDTEREVLAVARNTSLAPQTSSVAKRFIQLLESSEVVVQRRLELSVGTVSNPDSFLEVLTSAYAVRSFTFTVERSNPIDTDELFVKPFERLLDETGGNAGKATVKGRDLAREPLEQIARSAAATGDDATARVAVGDGARTVVRHLRGDAATVVAEALETDEDKQRTLALIRAEQERVRGLDGV